MPCRSGGGAGAFAIAGNLSNSGLVNLAGANPGNRLTVTGNYQGQSGALSLNAYLGADASPSDKLVVDGGAATGATALRIINKAGPGVRTTGDGIQVVQAVNGGTTSSDASPARGGLRGRLCMLFRGGVAAGTEQNWYLRSEIKSAGESRPIYRPGVALYGAVPSLARELAVQQIGTFHDRRGNEERFGDRRAAGRAPGATISEGSGGMAGSSFSGNTYGMQAGQDLYARTSDSGHQDRYGVFLGYASANGDVRGDAMGQRGYRVGKLGIQSHSVGAYWTHVGPGGWYTDTVILGSRLKVHPTSNAGDTRATRRAFTASVEAGLPIALKPNLSLAAGADHLPEHPHRLGQDAASEVSFAPKNGSSAAWRVAAGEYQVQRATWKPYARVDLEHTLGTRQGQLQRRSDHCIGHGRHPGQAGPGRCRGRQRASVSRRPPATVSTWAASGARQCRAIWGANPLVNGASPDSSPDEATSPAATSIRYAWKIMKIIFL